MICFLPWFTFLVISSPWFNRLFFSCITRVLPLLWSLGTKQAIQLMVNQVACNYDYPGIPAVLSVYVFTSYPCQWEGDVLQFLEITIASVELASLYVLFIYIFENLSNEMTFFKMLPFPLILIRPNLAE